MRLKNIPKSSLARRISLPMNTISCDGISGKKAKSKKAKMNTHWESVTEDNSFGIGLCDFAGYQNLILPVM